MAGTSQKKTQSRSSSGTSSRKKTAKKTGSKQTSAGKTTRSSVSQKSAQAPSESFLGREISILAVFAVCLILFLSNLGVCGTLGDILQSVQCGLFGILGYAFPICLFVAFLFAVSNWYVRRATLKLSAAIVLYLLLCGLVALITSGSYDSAMTLVDYFDASMGGTGGGAAGGLFLMVLCPTIGRIGGYVIILVLCAIMVVLITERSLLQPLRRGGRRVYDTAREESVKIRKEHAARAEERERERKLRMDQKVSGVALDETKLEVPPKPGSSASGQDSDAGLYQDAENTDRPYRTIPITGMRTQQGHDDSANNAGSGMSGNNAGISEVSDRAEQPQNTVKTVSASEKAGQSQKTVKTAGTSEVSDMAEQSLKTGRDVTPAGNEHSENFAGSECVKGSEEPDDSPMIPLSDDDILIPGKDFRTLTELEELDALHQNVFTPTIDGAVWQENETDTVKDSQTGAPDEPIYAGQAARARDTQFYGIDPDREDWENSDRSEEQRRGDLESRVLNEQPQNVQNPQSIDMDSSLADAAAGQADVPDISTGIKDDTARSQANGESADIRRVVTATGKVIEANIDSEEDPITRKKRLEAEQKQKSNSAAKAEASVKSSSSVLSGTQAALRTSASSSQAASGKTAKAASGTLPVRNDLKASGSSSSPAAKPRPYVRPPLDLLKEGDGNTRRSSDRELQETAHKLEETLRNFGVGVTVTNISCGPTVTRYELQPEQGVRVSKVVSLADDIKLNLAAADIRIEAPIPGKASIGIEVPNKEVSTVYLRDLLETEEFQRHPSRLAAAIGRDISGEAVVADLARMPHLLIAGATGSGKSVCINTLLMSILYHASPEEVRLILIDPKVVELNVYNGIPHLMIPVVTDPKKAAGALNWAVSEMTDRYHKFADWNVRDLQGYNNKIKEEAEARGEEPRLLPQILIIVDEMSDLMMVSPSEVEDAICRLAQMARAAGLHLILATQRPSVNVITGLIKANIPSRIAFAVSSGVDSRTILDMNGAEKLLGKGDMLFYPSGYQKPVRVQCAFVSDAEVSAVVEYVKENNQAQTYDNAFEAQLAISSEGDTAAGTGSEGPERDEHFADAGRFVIEREKATIGMLQRVFKIGFNRAARIMDQLAEAGVVGEDAGTKPREVLMTMEQFEDLLKELNLK